MSALPRKKLGELLLDLGLIDRDQLASALAYQRQWGYRLGTSLVAKGFISEGTLIHVLSHTLGIPMVDLSQITPQKEALRMLPASLCEAHEVIPLALEGAKGRRTLVLAMADPLNIAVTEEVAFTTGCRVKPVIASFTAIGQAIQAWLHNKPVDIQPTRYEPPTRRQDGSQGPPPEAASTEPFTLVQRTGEERVVANAQQQGSMPPMPAPGVNFGAPQQPAFVSQPSGIHPQAPPPLYQAQPAAAPGFPPLPPMPQVTLPPYPAQPPQGPPQLPVAPGQHGPLPVGLAPHDPVEELEKKFWALMRILASKGMITKDEFIKELQG